MSDYDAIVIGSGSGGLTAALALARAAAALGCTRDELLTATGQSLRVYPYEDPSSWPQELRPAGAARDRRVGHCKHEEIAVPTPSVPFE